MKKLILISTLFWVIPKICSTASLPVDNKMFLNDADSFTVSSSVKLGRQAEGENNFGGKDFPTGGEKSFGCSSDSDCETDEKCNTAKSCVSVCTAGSCPSSTPTCTVSNHNAVCSCTSSSCGSGKLCSAGSCQTCVPTTCGNGKYYNINTCACGNCPSREKCGCPGSGFANGYGSCTSDPFTCPAGKQQNLTTFTCDNCPADQQCTCLANQVATGSGTCKNLCTAGQTNCPLCLLSMGEIWDGTQCRKPCDGVRCPSGQSCINGYGKGCCAVVDPCAGVSCTGGKSCSSGTCTCPSAKPYTKNGTCVACIADYNCSTGQECSSSNTCTFIPVTPAVCDGISSVPVKCGTGMIRNVSLGGCCPPGATRSYQCEQCFVSAYETCDCPSGYECCGSGGCRKLPSPGQPLGACGLIGIR